MKTRASVIFGLVVVAGCGTLRRGGDPANVPSGSWIGQVVGTSFGPSRISGRVTLIPSASGGSRMRAEIELRNVRHPSRHLWIVRRGSCSEANGALFEAVRSGPLRAGKLPDHGIEFRNLTNLKALSTMGREPALLRYRLRHGRRGL